MSGLLTPGERDRARTLTTVLTGVVAAGSVAAVGAVSAVAAEQTRQDREAREARAHERTAAVLDAAAQARYGALVADAASHPQVVLQPRPTRTVVDPGVVVRASAPGSARPGPASASSGSGRSSASGRAPTSGSSGSSAARPAPAPVVVAPVVPSTGS
ncbi:hypothetical protein [Intrasporangium sp. YIM S08009]|uniref:hypothetical protein n=1 Tax=Intrasporangium zincisolvens TaxID=3080018 RepID=UPI002B056715|nr:hypothetical protein [Intrasporangium sp. YIM S08009]